MPLKIGSPSQSRGANLRPAGCSTATSSATASLRSSVMGQALAASSLNVA